ncbi:MAG: iron-sulfur cluster assembly scaffold protein [Hyphomicrobiaceae bacterium]
MTELDDIYNLDILERAANISHTDRLAEPDAVAVAHSKLCGSTVTVDIVMDGDRVADYGQKVEACLLGQAAAGIVAENIVGKTGAELRRVGEEMRAMLKEGGASPTGDWAALSVLQPVRDYPGRHASTLLVFDAVNDAIAKARSVETMSSR